MKYKLAFALVASISGIAHGSMPTVLPEFKNEKQLAEWRKEQAAKASSEALNVDTAFYTGRPYVESSGNYAFKYRSYNPELARWTSEDPSGFPDGPNIYAYAPVPTWGIDYEGLKAVRAFANHKQTISLSVYVYTATNSISTYSMNVWKAAVENAWKFSGTDKSDQAGLSMEVGINFSLQTGGNFNSNWASTYDDVITFDDSSNVYSQVFGGNRGVFTTDESAQTVVHEVGHFMLAPDMYTIAYPNGMRYNYPSRRMAGHDHGCRRLRGYQKGRQLDSHPPRRKHASV